MDTRSFSLIDRFIGEIDKAIKILSTPARASRKISAVQQEAPLTEAERLESARLMRVNHSGEVAAQALYQGQA
jgi:ubiquinone biosynthesis monooxygenase Coq7